MRPVKVFLMPYIYVLTQLCDTNIGGSYRTQTFRANQPVLINGVDANFIITCLMYTHHCLINAYPVTSKCDFLQITEIKNFGI
jgi:hypothetical protein